MDPRKPAPKFELLLGGKSKPVVETQTRVAQAPEPVLGFRPSAPSAPKIQKIRTREERKAMTLAPNAAAWWTRPEHRSPDGSQRLLQVLRLMADGQWHDAVTLHGIIPGARSYLVTATNKGLLELDKASGVLKPKFGRVGAHGRPRDRWRLTGLGRVFVEIMG